MIKLTAVLRNMYYMTVLTVKIQRIRWNYGDKQSPKCYCPLYRSSFLRATVNCIGNFSHSASTQACSLPQLWTTAARNGYKHRRGRNTHKRLYILQQVKVKMNVLWANFAIQLLLIIKFIINKTLKHILLLTESTHLLGSKQICYSVLPLMIALGYEIALWEGSLLW